MIINADVNKKISLSSARESNMELLRIVAMLMIVTNHFAVHSGLKFDQIVSFNSILIKILAFGGVVGVN